MVPYVPVAAATTRRSVRLQMKEAVSYVDAFEIAMPRNYVRWALSRKKGALTPLRFSIMMLKHAEFWQEYIQPAIKARPDRLDRRWHWPTLRFLMPLLQHLQRRRCRALVALLPSDTGFLVPSAMLLMIERYPSVGADASTRSVFVWYLAAAPTNPLEALGVRDAPKLGKACIDAAIVTSQFLGENGCIWLHADPLGGDGLLRLYEGDYRLMPLPELAVLPTLERRIKGNDGRYFFTDALRAEELASEFDPFRHEDRAQVEIDLLRQR